MNGTSRTDLTPIMSDMRDSAVDRKEDEALFGEVNVKVKDSLRMN